MPTKRTLLVTAIVALLVTTSGCAALSGDGTASPGTPAPGTPSPGAAAETPENTVDAEQVLNRTAEGMSDLETFTFDARISQSTQQAAQPTNLTATGAIDVPAGEARAQIEGPRSITVYYVNETLYMKLQGTWIKQSTANVSENVTTPPANVTAQPPATPQPGLFENATSISFEGNTTINGTDVYRIAVDVDAQRILNATGQQGMPAMNSVENVSATLYVTHDEYRLKRADIDMTAMYQGLNTDVDLRITLDDFNEDVTIDLPDTARNARSMSTA